MFGNCSFDDAIVALVHFVAKHPTLSILSSRFSTHNYRHATEPLYGFSDYDYIDNHKCYNFFDYDWFLLFSANSLAKLLSDSSIRQSH